MKIGFVTCVQLGYSCIQEIYKIGGKLDLLITLNDNKSKKKSGRIYLDNFANDNDIPLLKINNVNDKEVIDKLKELNIDWLFIIGWSQIAKKELLETPNKGCIGMHPTLLPKGRGRASIPWAIIKGLDKTGVTMFKLDEGVDTGDIIGQGIINLDDDINATELYSRVNNMHIELLSTYWNDIVSNNISLIKQDNTKATYWEGRKPKDGEINSSMTVKEALTLIRAVNKPYPGAFVMKENKKNIIWKAEENELDFNYKLVDGNLKFLEYEVEDLYEEE